MSPYSKILLSIRVGIYLDGLILFSTIFSRTTVRISQQWARAKLSCKKWPEKRLGANDPASYWVSGQTLTRPAASRGNLANAYKKIKA